MCRVSAWDTTVSSLAFESEVSIRRFLELLVLIFDTGVVLLVYSRWYCKRDLNCRNVVQHKNMRIIRVVPEPTAQVRPEVHISTEESHSAKERLVSKIWAEKIHHNIPWQWSRNQRKVGICEKSE